MSVHIEFLIEESPNEEVNFPTYELAHTNRSRVNSLYTLTNWRNEDIYLGKCSLPTILTNSNRSFLV